MLTLGIRQQFNEQGFACVNDIYTPMEVERIISVIDRADDSNAAFRRSKDLFAIRQFFKQVPDAIDAVFTGKLKQLIADWLGSNYFIAKSIYFDKPEESNWFVAYHQDLTISVDKRIDAEGFGPWTVKQDQFAVQPPIDILNQNITIRIHLDNTDAENGALKVLAGSHNEGVVHTGQLNSKSYSEVICAVESGGIMLMHPLLFHASERTTNRCRRRVIHIELSNAKLPSGLQWSEKMLFN